MPIKFLLLGGGGRGFFFGRGGGGVPILFLWAWGFFRINVKSTPEFRLLASISVLGGREEGAGWWAWEHSTGRKRLGGWRGL